MRIKKGVFFCSCAASIFFMIVFLLLGVRQYKISRLEGLEASPFQEKAIPSEEESGLIVTNVLLKEKQLELTFQLYNDTKYTLSYTDSWYLEQKIGGKWYKWIQPAAVEDPLFGVSGKSEKEVVLSVPVEQAVKGYGSYRLIKQLGNKWYFSEFTIPKE